MTEHKGLIGRTDATGIPLLLARLGVGGMFGYMAIMKILDPIEFLKQANAYGTLPVDPPIFLNLTAVAMPWLEIVCAAALLIGLGTRGASLLITGMLLLFGPMLLLRAWGMFTADGAAYASFCGVCFDCGCGTGTVCICWKMFENCALLLGALIALFSRSERFCLSSLLRRRRSGTVATAANA